MMIGADRQRHFAMPRRFPLASVTDSLPSAKGSKMRRPSITACDYSRDLRTAEWGLTVHFEWQQSDQRPL